MKISVDDKLKLIEMGTGIKKELTYSIPSEILKHALEKYKTETAIWFRGEEISYKELEDQIQNIIFTLSTKGLKKGEVVGVILPRTPNLITAILAIQRLGLCWLPIDYELPKDRINYMLKKSGAKCLITTPEKINENSYDVHIYININEIKQTNSNQLVEVNISPSDLSHILFTSGSTGMPKGVEIENKSLANLIYTMHHFINWEERAKIACVTSCSFDIFLVETLCSLAIGGCIVLFEELDTRDPARFKRIVCSAGVNYLQMTPTRLQALCIDKDAAYHVLSQVNKLILGGEAFPKQLLSMLQSYKELKIYNMYAPTETCVYSMFKEMTNEHEVKIGKPVLNTEIYILDSNLDLVSEGDTGMLWIGGAGVARGYMNEPKLTSERFVENPFGKGCIYNTGDIAFWEYGEVILLGRADSQVKIRGYRIELDEVENIIKEHPKIQNAAVVLQDSSNLISYFSTEGTDDIEVNELRKWISLKLPSYMIPASFIKLESIPQTANGKVDRNLLGTKSFISCYIQQNTEKHQDDMAMSLEEKIYGCWCNVLGKSNFEMNQNFFDIGGNSLNILILHSEIDGLYPNIFDAADLFDYATIESQCQKIKELLSEQQIEFFVHSCQIEVEVRQKIKQFCKYFDLPSFSVILGFYVIYRKLRDNLYELDLVVLLGEWYDFYEFDLNSIENMEEVFEIIKNKSDVKKYSDHISEMNRFEYFGNKKNLVGFSDCLDIGKKVLAYFDLLFCMNDELAEITVIYSNPAYLQSIETSLNQYMLFIKNNLFNIIENLNIK